MSIEGADVASVKHTFWDFLQSPEISDEIPACRACRLAGGTHGLGNDCTDKKESIKQFFQPFFWLEFRAESK